MRIVVKSKKDRDAIVHVFQRVYGWVPPVDTLSVEHRELDSAIEGIDPVDFTIVLLGREDARWMKEDHNGPAIKVEVFWKARIRNGRMRELVDFIEKAKLRFLFDVVFDGVYRLGKPTDFLNYAPGDDVYFVPADWPYRDVLKRPLGREVGTPLIHLRGGTEVLYGGKEVMGTVPRAGGRVVVRGGKERWIEREALVRENMDHIEEKTKITIQRIRDVLKDHDEVVVPFSGGKDSTVVALLLKEAGIDFTPVFVDTGGEYDETYRWVDEMKRIIGRIEKVEAPVSEKYRKLGEDYLRVRNCTRDKLSTLYAFVRRSFDDPVMVNGDRVAESKARSFRPDLRKDEFWIFSPIKLWSYLDEELYLWSRELDLPELYQRGFYRVGCSFCPFTDLLEKIVSKRR